MAPAARTIAPTPHRRLSALLAGLTGLLLVVAGLLLWRLEAGFRARPVTSAAAVSRTSVPDVGARSAASAEMSFGARWLAAHPQPALNLTGQAAILVDIDAGQVLWQRDPTGRRAPASLTKLLTAMVAADLAPLDQPVMVTSATDTAAVQQVEPTSTIMGLTAGEVFTVRELLEGLFLRSGNDAAETLASIGGRSRFVQRINFKAADLGMTASQFSSPVGLDAPGQYSTAYDLALAGAAIVRRYPALLALAGAPFTHLDQTESHKSFDMVNYNKLVLPSQPLYYPGATGMKTAFTDDAGLCMVASAQRGNRRLVAVILHGDRVFDDARTLLDYGFNASPAA
jgi:serine-type D-Ala-D-Ala carboxypeptidase (penicillin-binding protein 5/6)